ncbi:MAG: Ldh family oxidoreductase [bacterium]|nr:Ldh family oxidoreductase [bacterium]MDE0290406.1 Ldh family oxidoreductase [bacterium]MDE0437830.1 Ldh family oxidoreductase [bacterium]
MSPPRIRIPAEQLHSLALALLEAIGMPPADAAIAAGAMVWNELRGAAGHGLGRILQVQERSGAGGLNLEVDWTPIRESPSTALIDAQNGWGVVAGTRAMRIAIDKARLNGIGTVVVRNSDVTSAMGYYPHVAVEAEMVGLAVTNSLPLMPPWGGSEVLLGNQAFAIGVPASSHPPLVFDSSTSAFNMGRMRQAALSGERLPPGVALDETGAETDDAEAALAALRLLPMGGHRGGGLAIMWEVFTGILAGRRSTTEVVGMQQLDRTQGLSLYVQALDPRSFLPYEEFLFRVDRLISQIHANPPREGFDRVRVPGERKAEFEADYRRRGVPVPTDSLERLRTLCLDRGVVWPW